MCLMPCSAHSNTPFSVSLQCDRASLILPDVEKALQAAENEKPLVQMVSNVSPLISVCLLPVYARGECVTYDVDHHRHEDGARNSTAVLGIFLTTDELGVVLLE